MLLKLQDFSPDVLSVGRARNPGAACLISSMPRLQESIRLDLSNTSRNPAPSTSARSSALRAGHGRGRMRIGGGAFERTSYWAAPISAGGRPGVSSASVAHGRGAGAA